MHVLRGCVSLHFVPERPIWPRSEVIRLAEARVLNGETPWRPILFFSFLSFSFLLLVPAVPGRLRKSRRQLGRAKMPMRRESCR